MKDGQKLKLGDAHVTPKKYPRSTSIKAWGCPRHPLLHQQIIRSPFKTLYFYCFTYYVLFLERHFILLSVLFCFLAGNKWLDPSILVWRETHSIILFRTLYFSLFLIVSVLFLLQLFLALVFLAYFVQSLLVCSIYI